MALEIGGVQRARARTGPTPSLQAKAGTAAGDELKDDAVLAAFADAMYEEGENCNTRLQELGMELITIGEQDNGVSKTTHTRVFRQ
jgi:hypothetical protein